MDSSEPFRLTNRPERPTPQPTERQTQRPLFAGLDCIPGQQNLFDTDGYENEHDGNSDKIG